MKIKFTFCNCNTNISYFCTERPSSTKAPSVSPPGLVHAPNIHNGQIVTALTSTYFCHFASICTYFLSHCDQTKSHENGIAYQQIVPELVRLMVASYILSYGRWLGQSWVRCGNGAIYSTMWSLMQATPKHYYYYLAWHNPAAIILE